MMARRQKAKPDVQSNKPPVSPWIWLLLAIFTAMPLIGTSFWNMSKQQQLAEQTAQEVEKVSKYAHDIRQLSTLPTMAEAQELAVTEVSGLIESVTTQVNLQPENLLSINPQEARRLGDSPYHDKRTRVTLQQTTLRSLVELLVILEADGRLSTRQLRLTAPRSKQHASHLWNAELVLGELIYQPVENSTTYPRKRGH